MAIFRRFSTCRARPQGRGQGALEFKEYGVEFSALPAAESLDPALEADVADTLSIPVLCYGLRTDFQAQLFPGSGALLALADDLTELKTICHCGRKATMNVRLGPDGHAVREGAQIEIGGNERYVAMCRRHFKAALAG